MPKMKLTHQLLANQKPPKKRKEIYDTLVNGLFVRITKTGNITFGLAYGSKGKRYTIGSFPTIGLAEARDVAKKLKIKVALGEDPQANKIAKRDAQKPMSVLELSESFKERYLPKLKDSTSADYKRRIDNYIIPALGSIPANELSRRDIIKLLESIAEDKGRPVQSNRVKSILSSMYSYAVNRALVEQNPVKGIKPLGKEKRRKRYYSESEIISIWEAFNQEPEPYCSLFKMLLICGQRSGETRKMKWDDISDGIWTIPEEDTKAGRRHRIPIPYLAMDILKSMKSISGASDFVFSSPVLNNEPIAWLQKASGRVKKNSGVEDFRLHDLRRTTATYLASLKTERTVLGKILNHKGLAGDNQVTAVYDAFDYMKEKKEALNKWNHKLYEILNHNEKQAKIYYMKR
jgi:integrase